MTHRKKKIISHKSFICIEGGEPIEWESLTQEKKVEYSDIMMKKIGETLSSFISSDPSRAEEIG